VQKTGKPILTTYTSYAVFLRSEFLCAVAMIAPASALEVLVSLIL